MTHPLSEVKSFDERLKEIVQKVVDDAELRVVTMKPTYDSVDLGLALLRALIQPTPAETEGDWVLVPREPTKEMIEAGLRKNSSNPHPWCPAVYRAMIKASPKAGIAAHMPSNEWLRNKIETDADLETEAGTMRPEAPPPIGDGEGDLVARLRRGVAKDPKLEVVWVQNMRAFLKEEMFRTFPEWRSIFVSEFEMMLAASAEAATAIESLSRQLEEAREATETERFPKTLGLIHAALDGYVSALVDREHGGIAMSRAFDKICEALGRQPINEMDARRAKETVSHG